MNCLLAKLGVGKNSKARGCNQDDCGWLERGCNLVDRLLCGSAQVSRTKALFPKRNLAPVPWVDYLISQFHLFENNGHGVTEYHPPCLPNRSTRPSIDALLVLLLPSLPDCAYTGLPRSDLEPLEAQSKPWIPNNIPNDGRNVTSS
jgi:hypothetical protein